MKSWPTCYNISRECSIKTIEFLVKNLTTNKLPVSYNAHEHLSNIKRRNNETVYKIYQKTEEEQILLNSFHRILITFIWETIEDDTNIKRKTTRPICLMNLDKKTYQQNISKWNSKMYKNNYFPWLSRIYLGI